METKFEYHVSPELAEEMAIEQYEVLLRLRRVKLRYVPFGMACFFALLLPCMSSVLRLNGIHLNPSGTYFKIGGLYYAFTEGFLIMPIGFVFGLVTGLFFNNFLRSRLRAMARSAYKRMGTQRTVSWNPEGLTFQSPVYETKVGWQMIDRIEIGAVGVYGVSGKTAFFAIPRDAFPKHATIEDLIHAWKSYTRQPPMNA